MGVLPGAAQLPSCSTPADCTARQAQREGAGGLGWGNTGMRRLQCFFFGRINMQVYVDFEGSTMASFFRIFGGVSTAGA